MSNETQSTPKSGSDSPTNGELKGETPPTSPTYPKGGYKLEDFSQQRINRGQQEINYLIKESGERVVETFNEVRSLIATLACKGEIDFQKLDAALHQLSKAVGEIAGPFPPGCQDPPTKPGSEG